MKYTIEITGRGQMLDIAAITPDAMHYIQNNFGDDADAFDAYIDALKSGDVPKEFIIFSDYLMEGIQKWRNHEINDSNLDFYFNEEYSVFFDIYSGYELWFTYAYLSVKNEAGDEIIGLDLAESDDLWWASDYDEVRETLDDYASEGEETPLLLMLTNDINIDADSIKKQEKNALLIRETLFKGSKIGWIETDDEFDPRKLCLFGGEVIFKSGDVSDDYYMPALNDKDIFDEDRHYIRNVVYYGDDKIDKIDKINDNGKIELEEGWFDPRDIRVYLLNPADC